jgi:cobalt-zinc-cadmium efflux system outer membrane protein
MLRQAELLPNPAVEFDLRRTSDRAQPLQADGRIEYALTRALLTPARGAVAAHDLQAARLDAAASVLEAAFSATVLHARWEAAEERLRLARVSLATFAAARDGADALTQAGNISAIPAAAARASHEEARIGVARRELDALVAREALAARLGIADPALLVAAGPAVEPEAVANGPALDEEKVVAGNLRLRATGERLVAIAKKTGLLRLEGQTPDVVVDGHGEQDGLFVELGGGARISVPLFDRKQGSIAATEARYDGLAERFQAQARRLRAESRVVAAEVRVTDACARQYPTTILPARRNVLAETILMMNAMHASVFDVLDARRRLAEAESAAVDAIEQQKIAHARALLLGNGGDAPLPQAPMSPRTAFEVPGEMTH